MTVFAQRALALAVVSLAVTAGHAAVVVTRLDRSLSNDGGSAPTASKTTTVDVNGDGTNDFSFTHSTAPTTDSFINKTDFNGKLTLDAATAGQFLSVVKDADGTQSTDPTSTGYIGNYAETLAVGTVVGPSSGLISLANAAYDNRLLDSSGASDGGAFSVTAGELPAADPFGGNGAYVGFKLGSNYGYLEFAGINDDSGFLLSNDYNSATLVGFAYETTPNVAITVAPIPEPTSLAALAGVSLLALARRRRA